MTTLFQLLIGVILLGVTASIVTIWYDKYKFNKDNKR